MKIPVNWLKEYTDFSLDVLKLADCLREGGLPVETIEGTDDPVLEVEVTPNRCDCLSIFGVARQVSAIRKGKLHFPSFQVNETGEMAKKTVRVSIDDRKDCPNYSCRLISNVKVGESPEWLKKRIESLGLRSINNVVDVTNYVLFELGHPLHAFDFQRLSGSMIIVRRAKSGEKIKTIDALERTLSPEILVIADSEKPVAIAGIMGGTDSEVSSSTTSILLESAYFNPSIVRKGSKILKLSTEASYRFERSVDPLGIEPALNRASAMIQELAGGEIRKGIVSVNPKPFTPLKISLRPEKVNSLLGTDIKTSEMLDILKRLGFRILKNASKKSVSVEVPSFRPDVRKEIDLVEEIAQIRGYAGIPSTNPCLPTLSPEKRMPEPFLQAEAATRQLLTGWGFNEVLNYGLIDFKKIESLNLPSDHPWLKVSKLLSPLTEEQSCLRPGLFFELMANARLNVHRVNQNLRLFELGNVFHAGKKGEVPVEQKMLGLLMTGRFGNSGWRKEDRQIDFFDFKGVIEELFAVFGVAEYRLETLSDPVFQPGLALKADIHGKTVAVFGQVSQKAVDLYELGSFQVDLPGTSENRKIWFGEMDFKSLEATRKRQYRFLPRYPAVRQDIALIIRKGVPADDLLKFVKSFSAELIERVELFDVYEGPPVPQGSVSLAFAVSYRSNSRTLTTEEVTERHRQLGKELEQRFGAQVRK